MIKLDSILLLNKFVAYQSVYVYVQYFIKTVQIPI